MNLSASSLTNTSLSMLLIFILLSFFQALSGFFCDVFCLGDFQDVLDVDLSSLFIVREPPHRV
jgi:hypothetical protein